MAPKTVPWKLTGSTRAQLVGKTPALGLFGFLSDDDNSLLLANGTGMPWEYPTKTKMAAAIAAAINSAFPNLSTLGKIGESAGNMTFNGAAVGGGGSSSPLITTPTITGNTSAPAGTSVTLSASSSAYLWGGSTGIGYEWTVNGVTSSGAAKTVTASATVGSTVIATCRAVGSNSTTSASASYTVTTSANTAPVSTGVVCAWSNATSNTRNSSYTGTLSGATDTEGGALTYSITSPVGITITSQPNASGVFGYTVTAAATAISFAATVADSAGLTSAAKTITYPGTIAQPSGTSGALPIGTSTVTVPAGVSSITITSNGGGCNISGLTTAICQQYLNPAYEVVSGYPDGCWNVIYGIYDGRGMAHFGLAPAGEATTVTAGGSIIATANGSAANVLPAPSPATTVIAKNPATALVLTVSVAQRGGAATLTW